MIILRKILKIIACMLAVFLALIAFGFAMKYRQDIRNQQGYCAWKEDKKGLIISRDQRLDLAINAYMRDQTSIDYQEIELIENNGKRDSAYWGYLKENFHLLLYKNKEEFLNENQQCCAVVGVDIPAPSGDFWDWSSNPGTSVFEVKHKIRYTDQNGNLKEITSYTYLFCYR
jgi:hypothetical protein